MISVALCIMYRLLYNNSCHKSKVNKNLIGKNYLINYIYNVLKIKDSNITRIHKQLPKSRIYLYNLSSKKIKRFIKI
jgi:hypothetical protein